MKIVAEPACFHWFRVQESGISEEALKLTFAVNVRLILTNVTLRHSIPVSVPALLGSGPTTSLFRSEIPS